MRSHGALIVLVAALLTAACTGGASSTARTAPASRGPTTAPTSANPAAAVVTAPTSGTASLSRRVPRPEHVVVVVMENHSYADIIGDSAAPFLNSLAAKGALFTQSFAVTHPSEPNYLALFSGSTQRLSDDSCPHTYSGANLGAELLEGHLSFAGYSESMPRVGYTGCSAGPYARKHNPWADFRNVPPEDNRPLTNWPGDFAALPTLSYVIPNLDHDMHDGSVHDGDAWLRAHLSGYASWAAGHDSWLVITWDEDDGSKANHIPTMLVGAHVTPGRYGEHVTHYRLLRTVEDAFGLPYAGASADVAPITDVWR